MPSESRPVANNGASDLSLDSNHASSSQNLNTLETGVSSVPVARSRRTVKAPSYLSEYHCALLPFTSFSLDPLKSEQKTPYPISSVLSYDSLSPSYRDSVIAYTLETEP